MPGSAAGAPTTLRSPLRHQLWDRRGRGVRRECYCYFYFYFLISGHTSWGYLISISEFFKFLEFWGETLRERRGGVGGRILEDFGSILSEILCRFHFHSPFLVLDSLSLYILKFRAGLCFSTRHTFLLTSPLLYFLLSLGPIGIGGELGRRVELDTDVCMCFVCSCIFRNLRVVKSG